MIRPYYCLAAALLLTGSLGSIHAFGVFLVPFEAAFGASRASVSLIYSLALVALTFSVLIGHRLYGLLAPWCLAAVACAAAALGLVLAASASSLWQLGIGYSLLFGAANGLGYGFALAIVGRAFSRRRGLAMGSVTAVYAVGAVIFAKVFEVLIGWSGPSAALLSLAAVLTAVGLLAGLLMWFSGIRLAQAEAAEESEGLRGRGRLLALLWFCYGLSVAAGLMAIGHAAGIVSAAGGAEGDLASGVIVIALGNALGGFLAGRLADLWSMRVLLAGLPLISAAALGLLAAVEGAAAAIGALALVGFAYGAIIAVFPVVTARYFEMTLYAKAYGRIFTAWGLAGLGAPWLAGRLYDLSGGYTVALLLAAVAALGAALLALLLPPMPAAQPSPSEGGLD